MTEKVAVLPARDAPSLPDGVLFIPEISLEVYCQMTGFAPGVVRGWCERGYLPSFKRGKHRVINLAALHHQNVLLNEG